MFTLKSNFSECFFSKSNDSDVISKRAIFGRYTLNCDRFDETQMHDNIRYQDKSTAAILNKASDEGLMDVNIHKQ